MTVSEMSRGTMTNLQASVAECETVQEIVNIAVTAEALAVTLLGAAIASAEAGDLALNEEQVQVLVAARFEEQLHYDYLIDAGAEPITTTFTIPDPAIATDVAVFLPTLVALEEAFIAAYMAAAQVFAQRGETDLVQIAIQAGAVEADHRAHARFYAIEAGLISGVPNNLAYEMSLFASVGAAAQALIDLGFIGGDGTEITYPGPGEITNPGVINLTP